MLQEFEYRDDPPVDVPIHVYTGAEDERIKSTPIPTLAIETVTFGCLSSHASQSLSRDGLSIPMALCTYEK